MKAFRERRLLQVLCACYAVIWIIAGVTPKDRADWLIENILVFVGVPVLVITYRRLPLSNASYTLLFLILALHSAGAHYTYSEVPFGHWLKETFNLRRNHFDRIVHFAFGLWLVYPTFEVLKRTVHPRGVWPAMLAVAVIAALSGFFEIVEGIVALLVSSELGAAYLGTQGDVWDAQKDMALATGGALVVGVAIAMQTKFRRSSLEHLPK
jgi:putative membrane protein